MPKKHLQTVSSLFPLLLVFYELINYLSNDLYLPALPLLMHDLHTSAPLVQLTLTSFFIGMTITPLFLGPLSDRYGRRPTLLWGGIIFLSSTIACALSPNIHSLIAARFFQGGSICAVFVAGYGTIHELYKQKEAIQIIAWMSSITILAPALGPLAGGFLLAAVTWRDLFWILLACGSFSLLALFFWMPESHPQEKRHAFHLKTLSKHYRTVLTNSNFLNNAFALCLIFAGFIAWIVTGPFLIIDAFQKSTIQFGLFQVLIFGCFLIGGRCVKYGIEHLGIEKLIRLGLLVALTGGLLAFVSAILLPQNLAGLVTAMMIYASGASLAFGALNRLAVDACPEVPMGARMAVFSGVTSACIALGSVIAGFTYDGTLLSTAVLVLGVCVGACIMKRHLFLKA